jgi:hypothetical protein
LPLILDAITQSESNFCQAITINGDNRRNNKRLTITWGGGGGGDPFLSPFLLLAGDGGGAGLGVVGLNLYICYVV